MKSPAAHLIWERLHSKLAWRALRCHLSRRSKARPNARGPLWLLRLLDAEIAKLPAAYQEPVVLRDLEGRTLMETARMLGWSEQQVRTGLNQGRRLLHRRLRLQGVVVSMRQMATWLRVEARAGRRLLTETRVAQVTVAAIDNARLPPRIAGLVHWVLNDGKAPG